MLIASTTKIMTALVVLENCAMDELVTVTQEHCCIEGSSMYLRTEKDYTVGDLLYGMMLVSGNDAAFCLAEHVSGSVKEFAILMNRKAEELGLKNTSFKNPHGLDEDGHYSSARDLAIIMAEAMKNHDFKTITSSKHYTLHGLTYTNHNKLLWNCTGVNGGKTGYTKAAGRSLVTASERDGLNLICVTLSAPDDWRDHTVLFEKAYSEYSFFSVTSEDIPKVRVISGTSPKISVAMADELGALVKKSDEAAFEVFLPSFIFAPISQGEHAGYICITVNGQLVGSVKLVYNENVDRLVEEANKITIFTEIFSVSVGANTPELM